MNVEINGDIDVTTDLKTSNNKPAIFGYQLSPLEPVHQQAGHVLARLLRHLHEHLLPLEGDAFGYQLSPTEAEHQQIGFAQDHPPEHLKGHPLQHLLEHHLQIDRNTYRILHLMRVLVRDQKRTPRIQVFHRRPTRK